MVTQVIILLDIVLLVCQQNDVTLLLKFDVILFDGNAFICVHLL